MWTPRRGDESRNTGSAAELAVMRWLSQQGLQIITRNYRCKLGEIDLIMRDGPTVVFIEVRYRTQSGYGTGLESVDWRKQKKLVATANHFLLENRQYTDTPCRFDVISNTNSVEDGCGRWQWVKNAFGG